MKRLPGTCWPSCAGAIIILLAAPLPSDAQQAPPSGGPLADLWTLRGALEDTNGDGFSDWTRLTIELADPTHVDQLAAAANLTARLGFETMSMDLPLAPSAAGPTIMIGSAPSDLQLPPADDEAPRGYVYVGEDDATIHIWADDAAALAAATLWLAGRAPHIWDDDGLTLADAGERILAWAESNALSIGGVTAMGTAVRADGAGLAALFVATEGLPETAGLSNTLAALAEGPEVDGVAEVIFDTRAATREFIPVGSSGAAAEEATDVGGSGRKDLDLADLYSKHGLLGDANDDEIPDRLDAVVSSTAPAGTAARDLTARLGLESAGVRLPASVPPAGLANAPGGTRVIIGRDHPELARITESGGDGEDGDADAEDDRELPALPAALGLGQVDVLRGAYGSEAAILIRGTDDAGVVAAVDYVAVTAPYLGQRGKGAPTLATVRDDVRRFLGRRTPAGQAAAAIDIGKLLLSELPSEATAVRVDVTVDKSTDGLGQHLEAALGAAAEVGLHSRDVQSAPEIWRLETELEPEPEQLLRIVREKLDRDAVVGEDVALEARISEPLAVRQRIEGQLETMMLDLGASSAEVSVLPAYKQGFGWIEELVVPELRGQGVDRIVIEYDRNDPPVDWPYQAMQVPTRWLLELFPIDEILSRELGLPLSAIRFEQVEPEGPTYTVRAWSGNALVFGESFAPALVQRPYFDLYPAYEQVRVATGQVRAVAGAVLVLDETLPTDLDRVWDVYQSQVLPALHDYTMRLHEGAPRAAYAPHFGELRARIRLSEPDRPLGVDKERIAPMEALHEEIYFGTLHFFDLMGRIASGSALSYPGRVIPIVEPLADGGPGHVEFSLTGFHAPVPGVLLSFTNAEGTVTKVRRDLPPLDVDGPTVHSLRVHALDGLESIGLWLKVDDRVEERTELLRSHRERQVDASWVTSERLQGALAELVTLRDAGVYRSALAYEGLPALDITFGTGFAPTPEDVTTRLPGSGSVADAPSPADLVAASGATHRVQWRTPIPPAEAHSILAVMAQEFDEASIYRLGESYLGKEIWGLDLMSPLPGTHWSQAKATALKPTVVYSARQHANEVSSTSHVLRMAEMLLTDDDWREALQRLNVVVHPMTNPDGAQLAFDLHQLTPDHMLHAGYLGSLGVDVTAGSGDPDPIYPETNVRDLLWRTWLPDIFLNPHGYPSHEWVQPFSEYAGWVRHRTTQSRDWWGMRGWFMPGFQFLDDPDYPRHREHAFRIRDEITSAINGLPDIAALNQRAYARYRRYGHDQDPETFRLNFADDVLIYTSLKGSQSGGSGWMTRNPKVTIWSGTTEAPDETAHGDWLELVASAGLAWDQAILRYLLALEHPVERTFSSSRDAVSLSLYRERPGVQAERRE